MEMNVIRYPARKRIPKVMKENVSCRKQSTEKDIQSTTFKAKKRKTLEINKQTHRFAGSKFLTSFFFFCNLS